MISTTHKVSLFVAAATSVLVATGATTAMAQDAAGTVEEIVVTARKREESLQTVPLAISAISGRDLERQGIRQTSDLERTVPSLRIQGFSSGTTTGGLIGLRGQIATDVLLTVSQPVGIYEDNVNIPHPVGTNIAFFDLARVEVLKGPQGTLYGRNTTGGAINIITRGADYDGVHGFGYLEGGNYKDLKYAGAANLPIIANVLAVRLAYQHWDRDGFGRSAITGQRLGADRNDDVMRASLRFNPSSDLSIVAKLEHIRANRTDQLYQARFLFNPATADARWIAEGRLGGVPPSVLVRNTPDLFTNYSQETDFERLRSWHGVVDINWDMTDAVRLRSITGYHKFSDFRRFDIDALPFQTFEAGFGVGGFTPLVGTDTRPLLPDQKSRQWTQEFNLSGAAMDKRLNWLVGAFASDDSGTQNQNASLFGPVYIPLLVNFNSPRVKLGSWAVYSQNDFKLNDVFSVTLGARYTEERLKQTVAAYLNSLLPSPTPISCLAGTGPATPQVTRAGCFNFQNEKFSGTSYVASLNAQVTPDTLVYLRTAKGFRGGTLQVRAPNRPAARPEIATDFEIGLKSSLFDNRLRANLAAYQTNYKNKQEQVIETVNGVQFTPIVNAASARIKGFEAELMAVPVERLTLNATLGYLDAKYRRYPGALTDFSPPIDASGERFQQPRLTYNIGGRYSMPAGPGELSLQGNYAWQSKIPTTRINNNPNIPRTLTDNYRRSRGFLNASIDYNVPDMGLTVTAFSTNLTNQHESVFSLVFAPLHVLTVTQEPRMWGVSVRKTFGQE